MGKSRVTSKKYVTIPRLELVAAVLSVKIAALIRRELDIEWKNETFWTDSKVVLGYINNNTKKFKIFVTNQGVIQGIFEIGNCFWAHENRHPNFNKLTMKSLLSL